MQNYFDNIIKAEEELTKESIMSENVENIKKDMEENKELLNLNDNEQKVYNEAFKTIENRPVSYSPPMIQIVLMIIIIVTMIVGIIQIAS